MATFSFFKLHGPVDRKRKAKLLKLQSQIQRSHDIQARLGCSARCLDIHTVAEVFVVVRCSQFIAVQEPVCCIRSQSYTWLEHHRSLHRQRCKTTATHASSFLMSAMAKCDTTSVGDECMCRTNRKKQAARAFAGAS
jgi:hypothetical protein